MQLRTAGILIIKNRKLLLAFSRNKQCYYLPGGKIDPGETAVQALCREISEELNIDIQPEELIFYTHISAPAYGENTGVIMEQDCFLLQREVEPRPSAEIAAADYFSLDDYCREVNQAPGALMILKQLKEAGRID